METTDKGAVEFWVCFDAVHEWGEIARTRFADQLEDHDVPIAPARPTTAPHIAAATVIIDGQLVSARADLDLYCQARGLAGVPVSAAPVHPPGALPVGLQFRAAPGREALFFDLLKTLETANAVCLLHPGEARL
jgi:Asp-tRNA(Asn)/Glu-tRNA(Gln) amidotransferase A subunit family amidase